MGQPGQVSVVEGFDVGVRRGPLHPDGGPNGTRTHDLRSASAARFRLSYRPRGDSLGRVRHAHLRAPALALEDHVALGERVQRVIAAHANVRSGQQLCAALPRDDFAWGVRTQSGAEDEAGGNAI